MPKIGIISQARMTSTRLPGKVLKTISGKSLLEYHTERLKKTSLILATTINQTDDPIAQFCESKKISYFRGDENDVLSRYMGAAEKFSLDIIVRVTSDCPLIDGDLIAHSLEKYLSLNKSWLYMSNCLQRTYPRGFDFEIFSGEMLKEAFDQAKTAFQREHVTPYFYQNFHGKTVFEHITRQPDMSKYRLTVDESDDFKLIETLIKDFGCAQMSESEICQVLEKNPALALINQHIEQKK
jgi:spore coat polysaccharide biosynthesis protein SpsF